MAMPAVRARWLVACSRAVSGAKVQVSIAANGDLTAAEASSPLAPPQLIDDSGTGLANGDIVRLGERVHRALGHHM